MRILKPIRFGLILCTLSIFCLPARKAGAAASVTTTILEINGQSPGAANLSIEGSLEVKARVVFTGYVCTSESAAVLNIEGYASGVDSVSPIFGVGPGTQTWEGTLRWNPVPSCRGPITINVVGSVGSGSDNPDGCVAPHYFSGTSNSSPVRIQNSAPGGCCNCTSEEDDGKGGGGGGGGG